MDALTVAELARIVGGEASGGDANAAVASVTIDSRRVGARAAFFALEGAHTDGHRFAADAIRNGAVAAVVAAGEQSRQAGAGDATMVAVDDPLRALQRLAGWWRQQLAGRVLAVTGSNGKTIVKDALLRLLGDRYLAAGTLGSWNSQLGVPLAVLRLGRSTELAVLEAGVSEPGEMAALETILRPDFGLLTNVGLAHIAAFASRAAIAREKLRLFARLPPSGWLLAPAGDEVVERALGGLRLDCELYRFGAPSDALPYFETAVAARDDHAVRVRFPGGEVRELELQTPSREVIADLEMAAAAAFLLGCDPDGIAAALDGYRPAATRMRIWRQAARDLTVIDDALSSDPVSVRAALRTLGSVSGLRGRRVFVFGGMRELGAHDEEEHRTVGRLAAEHRVDQLVLVDPGDAGVAATEAAYLEAGAGGTVVRTKDVAELQRYLDRHLKPGDAVLFKGPRAAGIDRAAQHVAVELAPSRLLVDLDAVGENVRTFRRLVGRDRKLLAMVKALAYGSDLQRLGYELVRLGVDALGVATATEGELLRQSGVDLPVLVMLPSAEAADAIVAQRLTPVVNSPSLIAPLAAAARGRDAIIDVHLEVDTGMGRAGVFPHELAAVVAATEASRRLRVAGLMTHFACAEEPAKDDFTRAQLARFEGARSSLAAIGITDLVCHAANTAAAVRLPEARYDMVRIGIGLFGVYPSPAVAAEAELTLAVSLLSRIHDVRRFPRGASIGYGGTYAVERDDFRGALVPLGYHDAVPWAASNGGHVLVAGERAELVGRVSMDSAVVDVSDIPAAAAGTEVLFFGRHDGAELRPEEVASGSGTIAYELLARIGGVRIQRVYVGG